MTTIRKRYWVAGLIILALAGTTAWLMRPSPPSGPWRAQIVDAETGQALEGVIVLAIWDKRSLGWPHPDREHYDAVELVSDHDGRVLIPERRIPRASPLQVVIGPIIRMFKPGYGLWTFRRAGVNLRAAPEDGAAGIKGWQRAGGDAVFELRTAKTREERQRMLLSIIPPYDIPPGRMPRTRAAYDREEAHLASTSPLGRGTR